MSVIAAALEAIAVIVFGTCGFVLVTLLLAGWLAIRIPAEYFFSMKRVIDSELPSYALAEESHIGRLTRLSRHVDQPRSFPQYFFGQVQIDMEKVFGEFGSGVRDVLTDRWTAAAEILESSNSFIENLLAFAVRAGVGIGAVGGLVVSAAIVLVHLATAIICAIIAALAAIIFRGAEAVFRIVARVRMVCPVCARAARPYAIYKCPSCGEAHRDIRPGRRGIIARICRCGHRLPTPLSTRMNGLTAICPRCASPLPPGFGKKAEVLIPFIGSVRAGKTQLMYMLVLALGALTRNTGGTSELLGESQDEIDRIGKRMELTGSPGPTIPGSPEALVVHLAFGARWERRYIYLFDPAGELHYRDHGLDELHYLGKAHTLVYVADPLAATGVWDRLSDKQKQELAPMRSDGAEAEISYEMSIESIRRMGGKKRRMRLAFVVTKIDTLADLPKLADEDSIRRFVEDSEWMDMGNIVRDAMQSFDEVRFFAAAATPGESGLPDVSVERLAEWLAGAKSPKAGGR